jgi:hypothetical protein
MKIDHQLCNNVMTKKATVSDPPNETSASRPSQFLQISQVQDLVERQLSEGTEASWTRPLTFRGCLVRAGERPTSFLFTEENLVKYTTNVLYKEFRIYFDIQKYSPIQGSKKINSTDPAWHRLCSDLMRAAHSGTGMVLVTNGQHWNGCRKLICTHGTFCDKRTVSKQKNEAKKDYRPSTLNADYKNRRTNGRKLDRRTCTQKPIMEEGQSTCKWKLVFSCDEHGFYMRCGIGCGQHHGHAPPLDDSLQTTRKRLLEEPDRETLTLLGKSQANAGVGRNFMFAKTGRYMSTSQVRYVYADDKKIK